MLNQTYEAWVFAAVLTSAGLGVLADPGTRAKDTVRMLLSCFSFPDLPSVRKTKTKAPCL